MNPSAGSRRGNGATAQGSTLVGLRNEAEAQAVIHCAVYTRVSTEEQAEGKFSSLDAQREYCEAFLKSREGEGWKPYPAQYEDAGYSGKDTNRPALRQLLRDVTQGKVKVVVAYKYDRLSRDMRDFLSMLDLLERHGASFVSVTQQIDTSTPAGRVMRSILMTFSQFERETIAERTQGKIRAMRMKGMWIGGPNILGYDLKDKRLVINAIEAEQVKVMFATYLSERSLGKTALLLDEKGYRAKTYTTRAGVKRGGKPFCRTNLHYNLTNPTYTGMIKCYGKLVKGEHEAIIDERTFQRVQELLGRNGKAAKSLSQNKHHHLLKGLVRCAVCGSVMTSYHAKGRNQSYRYYRCSKVNNLDRNQCSVKCVPAGRIEDQVIERLKALSRSPELVERVVRAAKDASEKDLPPLRARMAQKHGERRSLTDEIEGLVQALAQLKGENIKSVGRKIADLEARQTEVEADMVKLQAEIERLEARTVDAEVVRGNFAVFSRVFEHLTPDERGELVRLLIKGIEYDGRTGTLKIEYRHLPALEGLLTADCQEPDGHFYQCLDALPESDSGNNARLGFLFPESLSDSGLSLQDEFPVEVL